MKPPPFGSLPAPASSFVGREREVATILATLAGGARLVTLSGPAGVGKTALAIHAARAAGEEFGPATFCDLSAARSARDAVSAVLGAIGATPAPGSDDAAHVARILAARPPSLLVLDNLEQIAASAAEILRTLLAGAPEARVVVTSRERLRVAGEVVIDLAPLDVPPENEADPERWAAVRLFLERARAVASAWARAPGDAAIVAAITRIVEGFPLAIELCAPRARLFEPRALLDRLERGLDVLAEGARGSGDRHHTLARAIDWSIDLLSPSERSALAQCCAFAGSFTADAAEAVIALDAGAPHALDVIAALVDKSLVRADPSGGRLSLYASVRERAARIPREGEARGAEDRHARHYLARGGDLPARTRDRAEITAIHARAVARGDAEDALRSAILLDEILAGSGPVRAQLAPIDAAIRAAEGAAIDPALRSRAFEARAGALRAAGRGAEARADLDRALALAIEAGDRAAEARARSGLAVLLRAERSFEEARAEGERALALSRAIGMPHLEIYPLGAIGAIELEEGDTEAALERFERAAVLARAAGDRWTEAMSIAYQGHAHVERGALAEAAAALGSATAIFAAIGDLRHEAIFAGYLAGVRHEQGDVAGAILGYTRAIARLAAMGAIRFEGLFAAQLGAAMAGEGRADDARAALATAAERLGRAGDPALLFALALHRLHLDRAEGAAAADVAAKRAALVAESPFVAVSDDVRFALRVLDRALGAGATSAPALAIGPEARWFELRGGPRVSLDRKRSLRLVLAALAAARLRSPGHALHRDDLLIAGWPGERVLPTAGAHRVRVAVASLRDLGLRGLLLRRDDGYLLDPEATITVAPI